MPTTAPVEVELDGAFSGPTDVAGLILDRLSSAAKENKTYQDLADIAQRQAALMRKQEKTTLDAAEAQRRTTEALAAGQVAAQDAIIEMKRQYDADITNPLSFKSTLIADHRENYEKAKQLREQIAQANSVSFFDNPLEYISTRLELPKLVEQHNLFAANSNAAMREIAALDSTLTAAAAQERATAKVLSTTHIADSATLASLELSRVASDMQYKALGADAAALTAIQQGNKAIIDGKKDAWMFSRQEQQFELAKQTAERQFQMWKLQMAEHQDKVAEKQAIKDTFRAGLGVLNIPEPTAEQLERNYLMYKNGSPQFKAHYDSIMQLGFNRLATGTTALGFSPGDAAVALASNPGDFRGHPSEAAIQEVAQVAQQLIKANPELAKNANLTSKAINSRFNGPSGLIATWNANPEASPIFKDPGLSRVADSDFVKTGKAAPFYETIIQPSVAAGTKELPSSALVKQTFEAVKTGKLSLEQAADGLSEYYNTVTRINAANNIYAGIRPQNGYNASIPGTGIFKETFNLADRTAALGMLIRMMNQDSQLRTGRPLGYLDAGKLPVTGESDAR